MKNKHLAPTLKYLIPFIFTIVMVLNGCTKNAGTSAPTNVDFTLDLNSSSNSALSKNGGSMGINNILIIRYDNGLTKRFYATQLSCTYAQCNLSYLSSDYTIQCPCHGCLFDVVSGTCLQGPAIKPLGIYKTSVNGNSLRIYE